MRIAVLIRIARNWKIASGIFQADEFYFFLGGFTGVVITLIECASGIAKLTANGSGAFSMTRSRNESDPTEIPDCAKQKPLPKLKWRHHFGVDGKFDSEASQIPGAGSMGTPSGVGMITGIGPGLLLLLAL